jgi:hypothetical protein
MIKDTDQPHQITSSPRVSRCGAFRRAGSIVLHPRRALYALRFAWGQRMLRLTLIEMTQEPDAELRREMVRAVFARYDFDDAVITVAKAKELLYEVDDWWAKHGCPPPRSALVGDEQVAGSRK